MNLTIAKEQILNGLQSVQNVVSTRTTLPILSNVLLRADGDRLELTATDLDVTVTCTVEASVKKAGATTVPVKKLFGIVRELNNPEIEIEVDDKNVTSIRSGASFFKIRGLGAEEYPPLPKIKEDKKVVLPQEKIRSMLRKTSFAISTDESRYVLNGIERGGATHFAAFEFIKERKTFLTGVKGVQSSQVALERMATDDRAEQLLVIGVDEHGRFHVSKSLCAVLYPTRSDQARPLLTRLAFEFFPLMQEGSWCRHPPHCSNDGYLNVELLCGRRQV
jgi:hypothetical protein